MATFVIEQQSNLARAWNYLSKQEMPFTIRTAKGKPRSYKQNRLNRLWMQEIAAQMAARGQMEWADDEKVRAFCKLQFGVAILRAEDEEFREKYDRIIKPHSYPEKLEMMAEPFDFPVTRRMSTEQQSRYHNEVHRYFAERGFILTDPEERRNAA